jgi:2-haloacid dehalogenase
MNELRVKPNRCLFVAGSAYDLIGTAGVGLPTWWHKRARMPLPENAAAPIVCTPDLTTLASFVLRERDPIGAP